MSLPGELQTEPQHHLYFNAPFVEEQHSNIRLTNESEKKIAWIFKGTDIERIKVTPRAGILGSHDKAVLDIVCNPVDFQSHKEHDKDRLTLEWFNAPGNAEHFDSDWLHGDEARVLRKKILDIQYNH